MLDSDELECVALRVEDSWLRVRVYGSGYKHEQNNSRIGPRIVLTYSDAFNLYPNSIN